MKNKFSKIYCFDETPSVVEEYMGLEFVLGAKSHRLHQMYQKDFPIPPGFTITTQAFFDWRAGQSLDEILDGQLDEALFWLEKKTGKTFDGLQSNLIVAVRSGAPVSMPGILDTLLNVGIHDALIQRSSGEDDVNQYLIDSYLRWMQTFATKVEGKLVSFEPNQFPPERKNSMEHQLGEVQKQYESQVQKPFPQNPKEQLLKSIEAVFHSWNSARSKRYRKNESVDEGIGLACTVQAMEFGNRDSKSGSGVVFSRNPSTGAKTLFGEFLHHQQGDALVDGTAMPIPLTSRQAFEQGFSEDCFETLFPEALLSLQAYCNQLEKEFRDVQDVEFVLESEKLWIVQTRDGKRTFDASLKIAVDFVTEGVWSIDEALEKVDSVQFELRRAQNRKKTSLSLSKQSMVKSRKILFDGLSASPGLAYGKVAFNIETARRLIAKGEPLIWFCHEASPEQIPVMQKAHGVIATVGGLTCHAAVVARSLNIPCLVGCPSIEINFNQNKIQITYEQASMTIAEERTLTLDGNNGIVYEGNTDVHQNDLDQSFRAFEKMIQEKENHED